MVKKKFITKSLEEKCIFLDDCSAFRNYKDKANPILNPDFHKYCVNSNNEKGYCPLYDHQIYVLKVISEEVLKLSKNVKRMTVHINKLEEFVKTE